MTSKAVMAPGRVWGSSEKGQPFVNVRAEGKKTRFYTSKEDDGVVSRD